MLTDQDFSVYVRDIRLEKIGVLVGADLENFYFEPTANDVGVWSLVLPAEVLAGQDGVSRPHAMCLALREPSAGIVVYRGDAVVFSGIVESTSEQIDDGSPTGEWKFEGVSDEFVLDDALSWPDPGNPNPAAQKKSNDVRKGKAEALLRGYVLDNIGASAPASRRSAFAKALTVGEDLGRGQTITTSPRFTNLLELCQEIARQGGLMFRVYDAGGVLRFEVYEGRDRSRQVILDVDTGSLSKFESEASAPGVTRPLVAGQDSGTARTIIPVTTPESVAAELEFGRIREVFLDQRQTDDTEELKAKGLEALEMGSSGMDVDPSPLTVEGWPERWNLGDIVSVRIQNTVGEDDLLEFPVTSVPIRISDAGVEVGATLGVVPDEDRAERSTRSRVSNLERNSTVPDAKLIWQGNQYLSAVQEVKLDPPLLAAPNGLIMVWSRYVAGQANDAGDSFFFQHVPKAFPEGFPSGSSGIAVAIPKGASVGFCQKYFYVQPDRIIGHAMNAEGQGTWATLRKVYYY